MKSNDKSNSIELSHQPKRRYGDSCEACRRRKRKCDAHEAPCAQCLKSGTECVFPASAAPARLARTLNELELHKDFISKLSEADEERRAALLGDWSRKHSQPHNDTKKRRNTIDESDLHQKNLKSPKKFKYNAAGHLHLQPLDSVPRPPELDLPLTNVPADRTERLIASVLGSQALSPNSRSALSEQFTPSKYQSDLLLTTYFCWQCPQHLTITKSLFLRDMAKGEGPYYSPFLLNALYAHASRHLSTHEAGGDFAFKARVYLAGELDKPSSIPTIQGLLILGGRDCALGRISQGFILAGIAFRMLSDMGLDKEDDWNLTDAQERTLHRRLVWSAYTWDKLISLVLGRAPTFSKPQCPLPHFHDDSDNGEHWTPIFFEEDGPPQAENYPPALAHESLTFENSCKLWMIIEDILTTVYVTRASFDECNSFVSNTHKQLQTWQWTLPGSISLDARALPEICPPVHILTLNLLSRTTWILLYRPYTLASPTPPFSNTPFPDSIDICRRNAAEINALFGLHDRSFGLCNMTYLMTYCAYVSATIDLAELLSNDPSRSHDARERLGLTFRVLAKGAEYTPGLQRSIALLKQRFHHKTQQQAAESEASTLPTTSNSQIKSQSRPRPTATGIHHTPPTPHTSLPVTKAENVELTQPLIQTSLPTQSEDPTSELDLDAWFSSMTSSNVFSDAYFDPDINLTNLNQYNFTNNSNNNQTLNNGFHQGAADFFDMSLATFDSLHGSLAAAFPPDTHPNNDQNQNY